MFIRSAGGVVLSQERGHGGGGFRLSSLRKSAIVAGLRGRYQLLRAVGDVFAVNRHKCPQAACECDVDD